MKGWKHAWNALTGGIKVEVTVDGSQGAQRAIMTLDPHALAADSVRIAEERERAREAGSDGGALLSAVGNGIAAGIR